MAMICTPVRTGIAHLPRCRNHVANSRDHTLFIFFITVFITSVAALATEGSQDTLPTFRDMDSAIDAITEIATNNSHKTHYMLYVGAELVGIDDFAVLPPQTSLQKRMSPRNSSVGTSWIRFRVISQGTYWSDWKPITCPEENKAKVAAPFVMESHWYYAATWGNGFSFALASRKARELGHKVAQEISDSGIGLYVIPGKSYGQLFRRQLLVWQDQQHQKCRKHSHGTDGIACEQWSVSVSGNLPVEGGQSYAWRVDEEKLDFKPCRRVFE